MAAPAGTIYGAEDGSNGKLGLYVVPSYSASQVTLTVEIWLYVKSGLTDKSGNAFSFTCTKDANGVSSKSMGNQTIELSSGGSKKINTYTLVYNRGNSDSTVSLSAKLTGLGSGNWSVSVSKDFRISGKQSFSISYNGNGGTSPSATKGTYGSVNYVTLATPSRTGYTFNHWYANLDGVDDYIQLGRQYMYTDKFSAHIEAYRDNWTMPSGEVILMGCTEASGWSLYHQTNNEYIRVTAYDAGVGYKDAQSTTKWSSLSAGWHSFDVVFDGTYLYLYLDGSQIAKSSAFSSKSIYYYPTNTILVGAESYTQNTPNGSYFAGRVRNVRIEHSSSRITNASNTFAATQSNFTMIANWSINKYYLDVNGRLDGADAGNTSGYGTFDVYVNGSSVANNVTDFYNQYNYGSTYEIKDIKASSGKIYYGVNGGSLTGTIGAGKVTTTLDFRSQYTVSYNANGGSGAPGNQTKTYGVNLTLSSTKPTKASTTSSCTVTINANSGSSTVTSRTANRTTTYTFSSWNTNSGGTGTSYAAGASYTGNAALTLYAIYSSSTGAYGAVKLPTTSECTRSGYDLLGFSTSSTATTASYSPGANYTPTGNVTLYAVWKLKTYTITYNGNGNIVSGTPSSQTKTHGTALTLSSTSPTRTRYKFLGWSTSASATSATYAPGASFTTEANTTLYAVWQLQDKTIWIYNTGKIDAVDFVTVSTFSELFDTNGKIYGKEFVAHSESNVYIDADGKIYAKEFIKY